MSKEKKPEKRFGEFGEVIEALMESFGEVFDMKEDDPRKDFIMKRAEMLATLAEKVVMIHNLQIKFYYIEQGKIQQQMAQSQSHVSRDGSGNIVVPKVKDSYV